MTLKNEKWGQAGRGNLPNHIPVCRYEFFSTFWGTHEKS